jgi:ubiquitin-protein ligase
MQASTASRRLQKEAKGITNSENDVFLAIVNDNLFHWKAWILGPRDTPYADSYFCLNIIVPETYPIQPPSVKFLTPVFHPNIQYKVFLLLFMFLGRSMVCSINFFHY